MYQLVWSECSAHLLLFPKPTLCNRFLTGHSYALFQQILFQWKCKKCPIYVFNFGKSQEQLAILSSWLCSRSYINMLRTVQISINARSFVKIISYVSVQTKTGAKMGDNVLVVTVHACRSGGNGMGQRWEEERQKGEQWLPRRGGQKWEQSLFFFFQQSWNNAVTHSLLSFLPSQVGRSAVSILKIKWSGKVTRGHQTTKSGMKSGDPAILLWEINDF